MIRSHILHQIGEGIAVALECCRRERHVVCCLRLAAEGVVHVVNFESTVLNFLHREVFGELVHDGSRHLQMGQLFGADVGIEIVHLKVT